VSPVEARHQLQTWLDEADDVTLAWLWRSAKDTLAKRDVAIHQNWLSRL
jgi:hypothetical protein